MLELQSMPSWRRMLTSVATRTTASSCVGTRRAARRCESSCDTSPTLLPWRVERPFLPLPEVTWDHNGFRGTDSEAPMLAWS